MKEVLINAGAAETRVALVEDGKLEELFFERVIGLDDGLFRRRGAGRQGHSIVGNIMLGRVKRVLPAMQAAFVDVGLARAGFLGAREARCLADLPGFDEAHAPRIGQCVREGDEILVQVIKDPMGEKGARLSANVTIPGRLAVLVPNTPGIALSRRIEPDEARARMLALGETVIREGGARLVPGAGYILRTAAIEASLSDLIDDAERLAEAWRQVLVGRKNAEPPALLYQDLDPVERTLRDLVRADTARIVIDDAAAIEAARAYCRRAMPDAESRIEFFNGPGALFDQYDLEDEIHGLVQPRVALPSGGWITIEATEALTAIDVNSGSFTEASGLEETSLRINSEAAEEIGRQVRLRGIGGLIVVDFIHLAEPTNVETVLERLRKSLSRDHTPFEVAPMSSLGLVEITRKRVRDPLFKLMSEGCHSCASSGRKITRDSVALSVIRQVERAALGAPGKAVKVRAAPDVVDWLEAHGDEVRGALARRGAGRVSFEANDAYAREGFDVGTLG